MEGSPVTSCPLCKGGRYVLYARGIRDYLTDVPFGVVRCVTCGLGFTTPQPDRMDQYYPQGYRRFGRLSGVVLQALYNRRAHKWLRELGQPGRALEIGSGAGWMLRALRRSGWRVIGNERAVHRAMASLPRDGIPVFVGGLDALRTGPQFDLVILFQVLEHLKDPVKVLQQCSQLLKSGGTLVVAVPNLASWQARLFGPSWFHLDVPRHLFHFTPASLVQALEQAGLTVKAIGYSSLEHDPYGWIQSLLNTAGFKQNHLARLLMGMDRWGQAPLASLGMLIVAGFLLIPSVAVAVVSWLARAGALMEMSATKPSSSTK